MMKSIEDAQAGGYLFNLLDKSGYNLQSFLDKLPVNGKSSVPQGTTVLAFIMKTELSLLEIDGSWQVVT